MTADPTAWHELSVRAAADRLGVDPGRGLTAPEVEIRRRRHGPNEWVETGGKSPWRILGEQLTATLMVVLLAAAVVSLALRDIQDAAAILAIVLVNSLLGFTQEFRAEKSLAALKKLSVPAVKVRREGRVTVMSSRDLVPGDVILLEAGNRVPADGRVRESASLRVEEASLTGESAPVEKNTEPLPGADRPLGDRRNMVYSGTLVTFGRGEALVTGTGMETELGRIAGLITRAAQDPTPLQKRLDRLARQLAVAALGIVGVVFLLGLWRGEDLYVMVLTAVGMAVAAVPEGLPAVVTIGLALGAQRMLRRRSLIRKLPAVETLGSVTVVCSDKTGTLTQNRMAVTVLDVAGHRRENPRIDSPAPPAVLLLLAAGALCNDAVPTEAATEKPLGDPTEEALLTAAEAHGLPPARLKELFPRVGEWAFDSDRKRMTTVHRAPGERPAFFAGIAAPYVAFTKGAADGLLEVSAFAWVDDAAQPLDDALRARIHAAHERLGERGTRVLGVAFRPWTKAPPARDVDPERDLIFLGLVGLVDPPRREVKDAVATCKTAGVRPVMITGDHPLTALHIARGLGITDNDRVLTGRELGRLSVEELTARVEDVSVYARVSPEHKLKIVEALQRRGHHVAMTGDGVNDAPALKQADIGVAMGLTGSDVSKEAADMVLLDDNFATIVAAMEEGRVIYDNIRKFVKYLLTTNSAEIGVMLAAPWLGMPLPLLPLQILWINLVTDGPTALTLSVEPAEGDVMRRPPRPPGENLLDRGMAVHVGWVGLLMTLTSLGAGHLAWRNGDPHWQTLVFTSLVFSQMGHVLAVRAERRSVFRQGFFSNPWLLGGVSLTLALQLALIYVPPLQKIFHTRSLSPGDLGSCLASAAVIFIAVEIEKAVKRRAHDENHRPG